ncbi:hypothetical protein [Phycicoccus sp. DTK01]|uniref:AtuA-related protein n=1 Tax=Phycicoccus sp. DTK01 TaxID=2785745 RepID=UPI001A8D8FDE|nr:hypothetical protein [Phycicoccus sp. DTK01]GIL34127.1 hypothetical protein PDTK01_02040 [Phycicoccus sp. DTK01]
MTVRVWDLAHGRSGDKGDVCNVGLVARDADAFALLRRVLTPETVKARFGPLVTGEVTRHEMANIHALNFVLHGGLDGGGTMSLRTDALGKVMYAWLLRMEIDLSGPEPRAVVEDVASRSGRG